MAARRLYGGADMTALISSSSPASVRSGFLGSECMLNFDATCHKETNQQFYMPMNADETCNADDDDMDMSNFHQPEKKRRLTAEKVQFLEKCFELENKLEPERKVQLAKDLGLQPKQVAIWFQNRRARWKTKQLEKDYESLKLGYDVLKMDFDKLEKEKEELRGEVIYLTEKLNGKNVQNVDEPTTKETEVKQEVHSSTNSAIDSESPRCIENVGNDILVEPAISSNVFDPDNSGVSYGDEDEEVREYHPFLKNDDNPDSFPFPVEDQALWFWPSY